MNKNLVMEKANRIDNGEEVVLSMREYDYLVDIGRFRNSWASMPNPDRLGLRDTWLVGDIHKATNGAIARARKEARYC